MTSVAVSGESRSFSTAGLPPAQQMEMWQAHHSKLLMALDCRAFSGDAFSGSSVDVETPRGVIARVRAGKPGRRVRDVTTLDPADPVDR